MHTSTETNPKGPTHMFDAIADLFTTAVDGYVIAVTTVCTAAWDALTGLGNLIAGLF
ncbi:hypothetical protein ACFU0X_20495 [Streptomyces cellulosae]|uniref:Uncharacterized protein n=1 Tax=Streptomyces cellulosae TaxID=1968 RepID=A0ABW6JJ30_STRCE